MASLSPQPVDSDSKQRTGPMQKKPPRYVDVANILEGELVELAPNSLLATEEQMARRFEVSRVTIRSALDMLENSGLISRLRGRGTVVSPVKLTRHFSPLSSFENDLTEQGIKFQTQVLSFRRSMAPPEAIRRHLNLGEKDKVGCLSLVRIVDDRVVCHDLRYYPPDIAKRLDPDRAVNEDCSRILEDTIGEHIDQVRWDSEIMPAPREVAEALGVASRTLVFANFYRWYVRDGRAVEAGIISYRVDRCKFRFEEKFTRNFARRDG
jgi:GntR family transcriptional regulator